MQKPISPSEFRFRTFGTPEVRVAGIPIKLASRKCLAILGYTALRPGQHLRESLAGLLWPEQAGNKASANLRVALASIRTALGPVLIIERTSLTWNSDYLQGVDAERFLRRIDLKALESVPDAAHQLQQGLELFTDPFFTDFNLKDAPAFNEWTTLTRERLRRHAILAREHLDILSPSSWSNTDRLHNLQALTQLDPMNGRWRRKLMHYLDANDQRSLALASFEDYRELLANRLQVEPSHDTLALYKRLKHAGDDVGIMPKSSTLPVHSTPFIGRKRAVSQIEALLDRSGVRLVTIQGPGGSGKSRIAVEVAERVRSKLEHQVIYVPLASLSPDSSLFSTLAQALGLVAQNYAEIDQTVSEMLADQPMLLVLDSFEHFRHWDQELTALVDPSNKSRFLIASRERLGLEQEWLVEIGGLNCDDSEQDAAKQIFLARAEQIRSGNRSQVFDDAVYRRICRAVNGLPLAIELAASWSRTMSPQEIAVELEADLGLIIQDPQPDSQSDSQLRAVFEKSWHRLTSEEQLALTALSIFEGGFSRAAAHDAVDVTLFEISALVDKSMLFWQIEGDRGRYDLHALTRQFAFEQLTKSQSRYNVLREDHATYFVRLADKQAARGRRSADRSAEISWFVSEHRNLRSSMLYFIQIKDDQQALRLCESLRWSALSRSSYDEIGELLTRCLAAFGQDAMFNDLQAHIHLFLGEFAGRKGEFEQAREHLHKSVSTAQGIESELVELKGMIELARIERQSGNFAQISGTLERAGALPIRLAHPTVAAELYLQMGVHAVFQGEGVEAKTQFDRAYELAIREEEPELMAKVLNALGDLASHNGRWEEAIAYYEDALRINEEMGRKFQQGILVNNLGTVHFSKGDMVQARAAYERSLSLCLEIHDQAGAGLAWVNIGEIDLLMEDFDSARGNFEAAYDLSFRKGHDHTRVMVQINLADMYQRLGNLSQAQEQVLAAITLIEERLSLYQLSLAWCVLAIICRDLGYDELASDLLTTAALHEGTDEYARGRARELAAKYRISLGPSPLIQEQLQEQIWAKFDRVIAPATGSRTSQDLP
jgi:predicted ATPase/DNA-binding SARP family transcriptional activator